MTYQIIGIVVNAVLAGFLFVLGLYIASINRRLNKLEQWSVQEPLCVQRHLLDEERIKNLMIMATKTESINLTDHTELKDSLKDIYTMMDSVKNCVHKLARDIEKRKGKVINESDD